MQGIDCRRDKVLLQYYGWQEVRDVLTSFCLTKLVSFPAYGLLSGMFDFPAVHAEGIILCVTQDQVLFVYS
jgi:hypothetical protein